MKTLPLIFLFALLFCGASCTSTKPISAQHESSPTVQEVDDYAGLGDHRDAEQLKFTQQLIRESQRDGVAFKVSTWNYKNRTQFYAQHFLEAPPEVTKLRGPNPMMGYHTSVRWYQFYPGKFYDESGESGETPMRLAHIETTKNKPRVGFLTGLRFLGKKCPVVATTPAF